MAFERGEYTESYVVDYFRYRNDRESHAQAQKTASICEEADSGNFLILDELLDVGILE